MLEDLSGCFSAHLSALERLITEELDRCSWSDLPEMLALVRGQLQRSGKHLRPLLMFALVDALGGDFARSYPPAVGVELFHLASLILDDIQDNSDFRHGAKTVHTTSSLATAINVAGIIRSLSYQATHRSACLTSVEKEQIHRRLDTTMTHLYMGQSIDVGWHERWYRSIAHFPYRQMITWKTGSLFSCAAWLAAFICRADADAVAAADRFGTEVGIFYQLLNDYLDVFGTGDRRLRPVPEDLREAKPSWPVLALYQELASQGSDAEARRLSVWLTEPAARADGYGWILTLMSRLRLHQKLKANLLDHAERLSHDARGLCQYGDSAGLELFVQSMTGLAVEPEDSPALPTLAATRR